MIEDGRLFRGVLSCPLFPSFTNLMKSYERFIKGTIKYGAIHNSYGSQVLTCAFT
jgi:hypothetical protein